MLRSFRTVLAAAVLTALPTLASAHTGVGPGHGFAHGFAHPLSGLDHMLAMVTVGLLAAQLGGRALWAVPATFVAALAIGGVLGVAGIDVPFVETGIALSVVVLGAAVAFGITAPLAVVMAMTGIFAVLHGHAHGTEMPLDVSGLGYGFGFTLATALLHLAGIGLGLAIGRIARIHGPRVMRGAGAAVAVAGLALVGGAL